jgi:hypothetical protein
LLEAKSKVVPAVSSNHIEDDIGLLGLLVNMLLWGYLGSIFSSNLLGAFLAGMSFYGQKNIQAKWKSSISPVQIWFVRVFFACSVAFTVDGKDMFSWYAFGGGVLIAVASILGKWIAGMFVPSEFKPRMLGVALSGRGEFAFVLAVDLTQFVKEDPNDNENVFLAILYWGLLLSCFFAPFLLQFSIFISNKVEARDPNKTAAPQSKANLPANKPLKQFFLQLLMPKSFSDVREDDRNPMSLTKYGQYNLDAEDALAAEALLHTTADLGGSDEVVNIAVDSSNDVAVEEQLRQETQRLDYKKQNFDHASSVTRKFEVGESAAAPNGDEINVVSDFSASSTELGEMGHGYRLHGEIGELESEEINFTISAEEEALL